jgi:hypothetical protein
MLNERVTVNNELVKAQKEAGKITLSQCLVKHHTMDIHLSTRCTRATRSMLLVSTEQEGDWAAELV